MDNICAVSIQLLNDVYLKRKNSFYLLDPVVIERKDN